MSHSLEGIKKGAHRGEQVWAEEEHWRAEPAGRGGELGQGATTGALPQSEHRREVLVERQRKPGPRFKGIGCPVGKAAGAWAW